MLDTERSSHPKSSSNDREADGSVIGIVVTYNTNIDAFNEMLRRFSAVVPLIICDNSTDERIQVQIQTATDSNNMFYLPMHGNVGIARAQNQGIAFALGLGASYILLIDDDSHLTANDAIRLRNAYLELKGLGRRIGAVSARAMSHDGRNLSNVPGNLRQGFTSCPLLNSSGTLLPVKLFSEVGPMDESLFIDMVDFEWGWRALARGYELVIAEAIRFRHTLGESPLHVLGIRIGIPSPIRHYYQTRNTLYLLTRPYVPFLWKIKQVFNLVIKFIFFPIFVPPRLERLTRLTQGCREAIKQIKA